MIDENAYIDQSNAYDGSHGATSNSVLTWLLWLRLWVMSAWGVKPASAHQTTPSHTQALPRARRHSQAYFERCSLPPARDLGALRALLPSELSHTQTQERLARISILGRVRIYQISFWGSVLLRRAVLTCYDHGWWRAPTGELRTRREPASLRPP